MKKEKTINLAARMMAEARWKGVTPKEKLEHQRKSAQTPRKPKRCFCGANTMQRAVDRFFECCRKSGVITLNLQAKPDTKPDETEPVV